MYNLKQLLSRFGAMKTAVLSLALIICCLWAAPAMAQPILYGVSFYGGSLGNGAIYHYDVSTGNFTSDLSFLYNGMPADDAGSLFQACNGKLYGLSEHGGTYNNGSLYDFDPLTGTLHVDTSFDFYANNYMAPSLPYGTLMQASNGLLYGTTGSGGEFYKGTIFSFDPIADSFKVVFNFNGADGTPGYGKLIQATNGKLYGMTQSGGNNDESGEGDGTIFEFDITTGILTTDVLFDNNTNGRSPYGSLVQASNGLMYGLTYYGGINSNGILFEFDPVSRTLTYQVDLDITTGYEPHGSLIQASNGKLYGTASLGGSNFNAVFDTLVNNVNEEYYSEGGTIFDYDPVSHAITTDYNFNYPVGMVPYGDLLQLPNGKLYGTTYNGGGSYFNQGTIFDFDITTNILTTDHYFGQGSQGGGNWCALIQYNTIENINPDVPTLTPDQATICLGAPVLITITSGSLNDAANWQWYSGFCGGTPVGTGISILVSPTATTTYFARGVGGCIIPGDCGAVTITVDPGPTPTITGGPEFCESGIIGTQVYASYQWYGPSHATTQTIVVNSTDNYVLEVTDVNGCTGDVNQEIFCAQMTDANAGGNQILCTTGQNALSLVAAGGNGNVWWSTSGDGTFDNRTAINAQYTPGADDLANGTVSLDLQISDPSGNCPTSYDTITVTIHVAPIANAGPDQWMCASAQSITLTNAQVTGLFVWSTSGDGTFDNDSLENPTYFPGVQDLGNGFVELFVYTIDPYHHCDSAFDEMGLTIVTPPTANTGGDQTMCSADGYYTLVNATGTGNIWWSSNGDGYFDNPHILNPSYYPGNSDVYNGTVQLVLQTEDPTSVCQVSGVDGMNLTILYSNFAYAGGDFIDMCPTDGSVNLSGAYYSGTGTVNWVTSGGGHFDDPSLVNPNYFPGQDDIASHGALLTMVTVEPSGQCPISSDYIRLQIGTVTEANTGGDMLLCSNDNFIFLNNASGVGFFTWSTSGDGFLNFPHQLQTNYIPGFEDVSNGSVILTLTAIDFAGICPSATSSMTLTVYTNHNANAGGNLSECGAAPITINNSSGTGTIHWLTDGDGSFNDPTVLHPVYTPGPVDILENGTSLFFETNNPNDVCPYSSDYINLTLGTVTSAIAGNSQSMCNSEFFSTINDATATGNIQWLTLGDGYFDIPNGIPTDYWPGINDELNGGLELYLEADDPANVCPSSYSSKFLTIDTNFNAHSGGDIIICASTPFIAITNATGSGTIIWTTNGDGVFNDPSIINPIYTPGPNDIANHGVLLTLTTVNPNLECPTSIDFISLVLGIVTSADAGSDMSMCLVDEAINITDASGSGNLEWTSGGTGVFFNPFISDALYFPVGADITNLGVELYLTATDPAGVCPSSIDSMFLTIDTNYNAHAGGTMFTCYNTPVTITNSSGTGTFLWITEGNGTFDDPTLLHPTYTPGSDDIQAGNIGLILTTTNPNFTCPNSQDGMLLKIGTPTGVFTLAEQTMCAIDGFIAINSASATGTSLLWTTAGDGYFDVANSLDPNYYPGPQDINDGYVVLTLNAYDIMGNCSPSSDIEGIAIYQSGAILNISDESMCADGGYYTFTNVVATGGNYTWVTSGDGSFDDPTLMNPTYFPGFNDYSDGSVSLSLAANSPNFQCSGQQEWLTLTIIQPTIVYAGGAIDICSSQNSVNMTNATGTGVFLWTTEGDGYFDDPTILNPNYYPGPFDRSINFATLYLTVTDITGTCSNNDLAELVIETAQVANAGSDQTICTGVNSITLSDASGTGDFNWLSSGDGSFDNGTTLSPTFYPGPWDISNGSVSLILQVIDPLGICPTVGSVMILNILPPASVTITANGPTTFCTGGSVTLDAGSFVSYLWSDGSTNETLIATTTNTYYVTVTNLEGCTGVASSSVSVFSIPAPVIMASGPTTFCQGSTVSLDAGNYLDYNWSTGAISQAINVTTAGTYSVTVSNGAGCTDVASQDITMNDSPNPIITAFGSATFCQGGSVILDANGPYSSYIWSNGSNIESQVINTGNIYKVTVSFPDGCTGTASQLVTVNPLPVPSITANGPTTFCQGGSVTLTTGNYNAYHWSTGANSQSIVATTSGPYAVIVTDVNGCTGVASQTVLVNGTNANPVINASGPVQFCQGGGVTLSTSLPYSTYIWSNGAVTPSINVTTSGTYTVTVSNGGNCTGTTHKSVTVLVSPQPVITPVGPTVLCSGGSVTLSVGNYYNYIWSNGATSPTILVSTGGIYAVTVSYATGCSASAGTIVEVVSCPTPTSLSNTNIAATSAEALWVQPSCAYNYTIQISKHNANVWTTYTITPNSHYTFSALAHSTSYDWMIRTNCNAAQTNVSPWSTIQTFTTLAHRDADEISSASSFNVYPNPANDKVTVSFYVDKEDDYTVRLTDVTGRIVLQYALPSTIGENQYQMDLSQVAKGIYMVILQNKDAVLQSKIVVQ